MNSVWINAGRSRLALALIGTSLVFVLTAMVLTAMVLTAMVLTAMVLTAMVLTVIRHRALTAPTKPHKAPAAAPQTATARRDSRQSLPLGPQADAEPECNESLAHEAD